MNTGWHIPACPLCLDPLEDDQTRAHPECLAQWHEDIERRSCLVCGLALSPEDDDYSTHDACSPKLQAPPPPYVPGSDPFEQDVDDDVDPF
jgi:hypothetical protein